MKPLPKTSVTIDGPETANTILVQPYLLALLLPHIFSSQLYHETEWPGDYRERDKLHISEITGECFRVIRKRKSTTNQENELAVHINLSREEHLALRNRRLIVGTWLTQQTDHTGKTPRNENHLESIVLNHDQHLGINIFPEQYDKKILFFALAPLVDFDQSKLPIKYKEWIIRARNKPTTPEALIFLARKISALKKSVFTRYTHANLILVFENAIENIIQGSAHSDLLKLLEKIAYFYYAHKTPLFYFIPKFNENEIIELKNMMRYIKQTVTENRNNPVDRATLLSAIITIKNNTQDYACKAFCDLLNQLIATLQNLNQVNHELSMSNQNSLRSTYLGALVSVEFVTDEDLINYFGNSIYANTALDKLETFLFTLNPDAEEFQYYHQFISACLSQFQTNLSQFKNKIISIKVLLTALKQSQSLLHHFKQAILFKDHQLDILKALNNALIDDQILVKTRAILLHWILTTNRMTIKEPMFFAAIIESGFLNQLLMHIIQYMNDGDNNLEFVQAGIMSWLKINSSIEKLLPAVILLFTKIPALFNCHRISNPLIDYVWDIIILRNDLCAMHTLSLTLQNYAFDDGKKEAAEIKVIEAYLKLHANSSHLTDDSKRLFELIQNNNVDAPIHPLYLPHFKYGDLLQRYEQYFAKIVACMVLTINRTRPFDFDQFIQVLQNQSCMRLLTCLMTAPHPRALQITSFTNLEEAIKKRCVVYIKNNQADKLLEDYVAENAIVVKFMDLFEARHRLTDLINQALVEYTKTCQPANYVQIFYAPWRVKIASADANINLQETFSSINNLEINLFCTFKALLQKLINENDYALFYYLTNKGQLEFHAKLTQEQRAELLQEIHLLIYFNQYLIDSELQNEIKKYPDESFQNLINQKKFPNYGYKFKDLSCRGAMIIGAHPLSLFVVTGLNYFVELFTLGEPILYPRLDCPSELVKLKEDPNDACHQYATLILQISKINFEVGDETASVIRAACHLSAMTLGTSELLLSIWQELLKNARSHAEYYAAYHVIATEFPVSIPRRDEFLQATSSQMDLIRFFDNQKQLIELVQQLTNNPELLLKDSNFFTLFSSAIINSLLGTLTTPDRNARCDKLKDLLNYFKLKQDQLICSLLQNLIDVFSNSQPTYSLDKFYIGLNTPITLRDFKLLYLIASEQQRIKLLAHTLPLLKSNTLHDFLSNLQIETLHNELQGAYNTLETNKKRSLTSAVIIAIDEWIQNQDSKIFQVYIHRLAVITEASPIRPRLIVFSDETLEGQPQQRQSTPYAKQIEQLTSVNHACNTLAEAVLHNTKCAPEMLSEVKNHVALLHKRNATHLLDSCIKVLTSFFGQIQTLLTHLKCDMQTPNLENLTNTYQLYLLLIGSKTSEIPRIIEELTQKAIMKVIDAFSPYTLSHDALEMLASDHACLLKHIIVFFQIMVPAQSMWLQRFVLNRLEQFCIYSLHMTHSDKPTTNAHNNIKLVLKTMACFNHEKSNLYNSIALNIPLSTEKAQVACSNYLSTTTSEQITLAWLRNLIEVDIMQPALDALVRLLDKVANDPNGRPFNKTDEFKRIIYQLQNNYFYKNYTLQVNFKLFNLTQPIQDRVNSLVTAINDLNQILQNVSFPIDETELTNDIGKRLTALEQEFDATSITKLRCKIDIVLRTLAAYTKSGNVIVQTKEFLLGLVNTKGLRDYFDDFYLKRLLSLVKLVYHNQKNALSLEKFNQILALLKQLDIAPDFPVRSQQLFILEKLILSIMQNTDLDIDPIVQYSESLVALHGSLALIFLKDPKQPKLPFFLVSHHQPNDVALFEQTLKSVFQLLKGAHEQASSHSTPNALHGLGLLYDIYKALPLGEHHKLYLSSYIAILEQYCNNLREGNIFFEYKSDDKFFVIPDKISSLLQHPKSDFIEKQVGLMQRKLKSLLDAADFSDQKTRSTVVSLLLFIVIFGDTKCNQSSWQHFLSLPKQLSNVARTNHNRICLMLCSKLNLDSLNQGKPYDSLSLLRNQFLRERPEDTHVEISLSTN